MVTSECTNAAQAMSHEAVILRHERAVARASLQERIPGPLVPFLRLWPHIRPLARQRWPNSNNLARLSRSQDFLSAIHRIAPEMLWLAWVQIPQTQAILKGGER